MRQKRLIVSADDFGMSTGVNAGVIRAHREGILTNASLMVTGAAFPQAVELARQNPTLGVGLHLVLVQGRAASPPDEIPLLVDCRGNFRSSAPWAGLRYFFSPAARAQLRREIGAQLERFAATGLPLSHVDGHLNIHMHPTVLAILTDLAPSHSVRALRLPREPLAAALSFDRSHLGRKLCEAMVFTLLGRLALKRLAGAGIAYADRVFGLHQTGRVTEAYLLGVLDRLKQGVTEIYCHAGFWDAESRRWRPADYEPEVELGALCSGGVRAALEAAGIELISYRQLWQSR